jgi:hypothetical protein
MGVHTLVPLLGGNLGVCMRVLTILTFLFLCSISAFPQSSSSSDVKACAIDMRWLNTDGSLQYRRGSEAQNLSFLVHQSGCPSAEVTVSATYLTDTQDYICSGTVRHAMSLSTEVQEFNIAIRPFIQTDFVRWRNQPGVRGEQAGKRLDCLNIDGTAGIGDSERLKASWMRLSIGVIATGGSVAVTEALFKFQ